ncbi:uncharacterized protein V1518DRAFT_411164 [Limtongia smithiae]|uniref:uncharacterized protein n=1 Tax=Limtongia smithiae TaxID=1125753 RepID=UPI0034CEB127
MQTVCSAHPQDHADSVLDEKAALLEADRAAAAAAATAAAVAAAAAAAAAAAVAEVSADTAPETTATAASADTTVRTPSTTTTTVGPQPMNTDSAAVSPSPVPPVPAVVITLPATTAPFTAPSLINAYQRPYYPDTPVSRSTPQPTRAQVALQRRLALANLPPITPVTTRSKDRRASTSDADTYYTVHADSDSCAAAAAIDDAGALSPSDVTDGPLPAVNIDLNTNTDYIALCSTLELLACQRETASEDIATLQRLKFSALDDPHGFVEMLKKDGRVDGAPRMQAIVRAPVVRWSKYGISNPSLEKEIEKGVVNRDQRIGAVRVFGEPQGHRKASA